MRYRSQRDDDTEVRSKLRELAQQRRRFGYRRLHILLRREGIVINRKKTRRLNREESWRSDGDAIGAVPSVHGHPHRFWRCPTSAGAWTSCMISLRQGVGSGC
ncbi:HTH-like domain-containing protein [Novosphingobium sp. B1]|nr:HTH-like domain-containing protein [Novosphingobium sp. B1]